MTKIYSFASLVAAVDCSFCDFSFASSFFFLFSISRSSFLSLFSSCFFRIISTCLTLFSFSASSRSFFSISSRSIFNRSCSCSRALGEYSFLALVVGKDFEPDPLAAAEAVKLGCIFLSNSMFLL